DGLREADAGAAGDARIAIGHVGDRLLAVSQHAGHAQRAELDQRTAENGVNEEDVGCAIGRQAARQIVGAGDRFRSRHARSLALYPWTVEPGAKPDNATSCLLTRTRDAAELCVLPSCAATGEQRQSVRAWHCPVRARASLPHHRTAVPPSCLPRAWAAPDDRSCHVVRPRT